MLWFHQIYIKIYTHVRDIYIYIYNSAKLVQALEINKQGESQESKLLKYA